MWANVLNKYLSLRLKIKHSQLLTMRTTDHLETSFCRGQKKKSHSVLENLVLKFSLAAMQYLQVHKAL